MSKVGVYFSTCDRTELSRQSVEPLLDQAGWDLHWCDGSKTDEGKKLPDRFNFKWMHRNICGGSGPAIIYALTDMLRAGYEFGGLCENDVLLDKDWFRPTMGLFEVGKRDGLEVGAVSARSYEDRLLIQRDGYGIMHNIGAGFIIFSRQAAEIVLQTYRTVWTTENRLLFAQLSGIDLGSYWAFKGAEHFLVADWNFDRVLAANGLASLALTPNRATMLDQDIGPLGLKYADGNFELAKNPAAFEMYRDKLLQIRLGKLEPGINYPFYFDGHADTIFPHQIPQIGGSYVGTWHVRDFLGFGPFCWKAGQGYPELVVPVLGPCDIIVSGGEHGGKFRVEDEQSGYSAEPMLPIETPSNFLQLSVPSSAAAYRNIRLTALSPGICFMGLKTKEPQPYLPHIKFDYSTLPPP